MMIAMRRPASPAAREQTVDDSLRFTIIAPETVRAGTPVRITLHVTNTTSHAVEAHFLGRDITFDIVVTRRDGSVVWQRLAHAVVQGILQVKTLAPNDTLKLSDVWRQEDDAGKPVPPGNYTLWGVLPSDEREARRTETAHLRINP